MRNAPDLVGALRARAVAHVLRLAGSHAVLDGRREAAERHLRAAPAVWASCADPPAHFLATGSATRSRTIGPASSGPPTWAGLTRTELTERYQRHRSAERLDRALRTLAEYGLARGAGEATKGRATFPWGRRSARSGHGPVTASRDGVTGGAMAYAKRDAAPEVVVVGMPGAVSVPEGPGCSCRKEGRHLFPDVRRGRAAGARLAPGVAAFWLSQRACPVVEPSSRRSRSPGQAR